MVSCMIYMVEMNKSEIGFSFMDEFTGQHSHRVFISGSLADITHPFFNEVAQFSPMVKSCNYGFGNMSAGFTENGGEHLKITFDDWLQKMVFSSPSIIYDSMFLYCSSGNHRAPGRSAYTGKNAPGMKRPCPTLHQLINVGSICMFKSM